MEDEVFVIDERIPVLSWNRMPSAVLFDDKTCGSAVEMHEGMKGGAGRKAETGTTGGRGFMRADARRLGVTFNRSMH